MNVQSIGSDIVNKVDNAAIPVRSLNRAMMMGDNLGLLLLEAFLWFDDGLLSAMNEGSWPNMTRSQSLLYAHLEADARRPSEIARRMGVSRQAVHRLVHEMETAGLVEVRPDSTDSRATVVTLTRRGRKNVEDARFVLQRLEAELAARIGDEQVARLRQALAAEWGEPPRVKSDGQRST